MELSWADRRLGAVSDGDDGLSVLGTVAGPVAESAHDLPVVRATDQGGAVEAGPAPVMEPWEVSWRRSLKIQRDLREELAREAQRGVAILSANMTRREAWDARQTNAASSEWADDESSLDL